MIYSIAKITSAACSNTPRRLLACTLTGLAMITAAAAQTTYTAIDLTAPGSYGTAHAASAGQAAGFTSTSPTMNPTRAALWTGDGLIELHPALLDDPSSGLFGRSLVRGFAGNLQVGWGAGPTTANRSVALAWRDTADSATILPAPFTSFGSQAFATDGSQIVGYAIGFNRDGTTIGLSHAIVWDATTGTPTDLGDGGNGAQALGVSGGQQAGFIYKGSGAVAAIWTGSSRSLLVIHPKDAVVSEVVATDGVRQAGFIGVDRKIFLEKRGRTARYNYASVWSGTATSAINIHPYFLAQSYDQSFATSISGPRIVGFAYTGMGAGSLTTFHAIVWDAALQATDLNAFLPAGFVGAMANSVDAEGNIAGVMITADGQRHAVLWIPNP